VGAIIQQYYDSDHFRLKKIARLTSWFVLPISSI
jgi:hypothetical protein